MSKTVWTCARCNRKLTGNPRWCPMCGHTVFHPDYPESVATEHPIEAEEGWLGCTDSESDDPGGWAR